MTNTESTNRERASMVSSSSKRFSSIGLLYTVVFFMITSFGTAKIQNYYWCPLKVFIVKEMAFNR